MSVSINVPGTPVVVVNGHPPKYSYNGERVDRGKDCDGPKRKDPTEIEK